MLVLSRKTGETVVIGSDVSVTVLEVRGDKVHLGIQAPKEVPVNRHEIWVKLQADGKRFTLPTAHRNEGATDATNNE